MNFTLDQLQVLDAIHRLGSFSAAARSLHRSTPAVSYAVKSLEEALGLALFDRTGHRAVLTPAAHTLLAEARRVLRNATELADVADRLKEGWEPHLTVVIDGLMPMHHILDAVRRLSESGAPTRLRIRVEYLTGVFERFATEGDLMIALDVTPRDGWIIEPLEPITLHLLAHREHALHRLNGPIRRQDLAHHVELVVADSGAASSDRDHRLWLGSPHVFQVSDFHTKVQAVRAGVGFGWVPEHLLHTDLGTGELKPVPFVEGCVHQFVPHLVRRTANVGHAARYFWSRLLDGPHSDDTDTSTQRDHSAGDGP